MKIPGPDHPITVEPAGERWRVRFEDAVIADSANALVLKEAGYAPVIYFPKDDVAMEYAARTDRTTHCPYKGDATYWTFHRHSDFAENVAWSYEEPFPAMAEIAGHIAFYADRVEVYRVDDEAVNPHHLGEPRAVATDVDAVVQHTDAGDGTTQREHWPSNVEGPEREGGVR
jgi:uncharacterized protein (DUF427 family)